jgi:hypothetical protein
MPMTTKTVSSMSTKSGRVTAVSDDDGAKGMLRLATDPNTILTTEQARDLGKWLIEWSGTENIREGARARADREELIRRTTASAVRAYGYPRT